MPPVHGVAYHAHEHKGAHQDDQYRVQCWFSSPAMQMLISQGKMKIMAKLTFSARLENLELMLRFIKGGAEKLDFSSKKLNQIQIASEEALVNIINYAYPDEDGSVEIVYNIEDGESLVIQITDWGIPFDPLSLPDPDTEAPLEERAVGGLGVYMMRSVMDEVRYKREGERNILTLVKS